MLVGVPKEIKIHEYRVGLTPSSARELIHHGHQVVVETNAGAGIGFDDETYRAVGAEVVGTAEEVFAAADMIVKVKEPQESEYGLLREGQVLYTYLHLAPDLPQTKGLIESGCIAVAYETVTNARGGLPLLGAHERGGGPHVGPGRRPLPGEGAGRLRHAAGRRARRGGGQGGDHRRRRLRAPTRRAWPWAWRPTSPSSTARSSSSTPSTCSSAPC